MRKGLSNNTGTGELELSPLPGPTICGRVPILSLVHTYDIATHYRNRKRVTTIVNQYDINGTQVSFPGGFRGCTEILKMAGKSYSSLFSYSVYSFF